MKRCPKCNTNHEDSVLTCDCGEDLSSVNKIIKSSTIYTKKNVVNNYPTLMFISSLFRILAVIIFIIVIGIVIFEFLNHSISLLNSVLYIIIILISSTSLFAMSELIQLFINIESNTRVNKK